MKITDTMNLDQLAERMGSVATQADAAVMRDLLVAQFDGQDTSDISEAEWLGLLDQVASPMEGTMYRVVATTDNPSVIGHSINVSTLLSADAFLTAAEAEARIPAYKQQLVELGGYSPELLKQMTFSVASAE